jgi:Kef-type K+ transport system membrane component KefB/CBS domain-containing protein
MNILFLIGIAIFFGAFGGRIFQKFKIPQVVGYIIIGVLLGESVLGILKHSTVDAFTPIINVALGLIGFMIGSELKGEVFRKYGRSIYTILISEGMLAFVLVTIFVTILTKKLYLGLILGAIASATDPASTVNVLWEYKTRGPLTTTLTAIVALDDGLALILYGLVSVFSRAMIAKEEFSLWQSIGLPLFEIFQCFLLGIIGGILLAKLISRIYIKEKELELPFVLGVVILVVGVSIYLHLDLIFSSMVLGLTLRNIIPEISQRLFKTVKEMAAPLYILFFVIVGVSLDIHVFAKVSILLIISLYLVARSSGKIIGATVGGIIAKARKTVSQYTGICLFTQGGVAIGLAMSISHNLSHLGEQGILVGNIIVSVVAATTFVVQLIGPILVKLGVTRADEVWRNITKEDIIDSYKISDVMQKDFSLIREDATLNEIIKTIKEKESYRFPVVNKHNELIGLISLEEIRNALLEEQLNQIVLARDVAVPVGKVLYQEQPLKEAFEIFDKRKIDYLPVVKFSGSAEVVGILEYRPLVDLIDRKLLERHRDLET